MTSSANSLKVSRLPGGEPEIFLSLQGEGAATGTPSVFLRLALCNLVCTWCDTKYTWDWRTYDYRTQVVELSLDRVSETILKHDCRHLVITGGEPLMQQKSLVPLVRSLKERGFSFEVETNGTIAPERGLVEDVDQWNVSPKLQNSGNSARRREVPAAIESLRELPNAYFKMVVARPSDIQEVNALVHRYALRRDRVMLMPEGRTTETLEARTRWVTEACLREGFRFTPRLHILLWGDTRGR